MTQDQFAAECAERTILPSIAVENEKLLAALIVNDDKQVLHLLDTEF